MIVILTCYESKNLDRHYNYKETKGRVQNISFRFYLTCTGTSKTISEFIEKLIVLVCNDDLIEQQHGFTLSNGFGMFIFAYVYVYLKPKVTLHCLFIYLFRIFVRDI